MEKKMSDSSMMTELDDILMSINQSDEELSFFMGIVKDLNIQISEYTKEEALLIKKSQTQEISESEVNELEMILKKSQDELNNQEDMVRSFLAQCNRDKNSSVLMIH
jgi:hypothetical protein